MATELWRPCVGYPTLHISHPGQFVRNASNHKLLVRSLKIYNDTTKKVTRVNADTAYEGMNPLPQEWTPIPNHTRYSINGNREIRHGIDGDIRSVKVRLNSANDSPPINELYASTWGVGCPNTTLADHLQGETWKSSSLFLGYDVSQPGRYVRTYNKRLITRWVAVAYPGRSGSMYLDIDELVRTLRPREFTPIPANPTYEVNEHLQVRHRVHLTDNPLLVHIPGHKGLLYYDIEHMYEQAFTPVEERLFYKRIIELQEQYPNMDASAIYKVSPIDRGNLLCIRRPDLLPELVDQSKIFTLPAGTTELEDWRCLPHKTNHRRSVVDRAVKNCRPNCCHLTKEELATIGHNSQVVGEETEKYCEELLRHVTGVVKVVRVGHLSNPCHDVEVNLVDQKVRAVQAKTLWQSKQNPNQFCISSLGGYDPGVLIVAVNPDFTDYGFVCLAGELEEGVDTLTISFGTRARIYPDNKFTTHQGILDSIAKYLPSTIEVCQLKKIYGDTNLKEKESLGRLETECGRHGLSYRPHINNYEVIDCWIQEQSCQAKYSNVRCASKWIFRIAKSAPAGSYQPYSITDNIQFFVFEIGGKYPGQFMIIPMEVMISEGYITTLDQDGRSDIYLPPPDYPDKTHWAMKYWNNFGQLTSV